MNLRPWFRLPFFLGLAFSLVSTLSLHGQDPERGTLSAHIALVPSDKAGEARSDNSQAVVWLTRLDGSFMKRTKDSHRYQMVQQNKHFEPSLLVVPVGTVVAFPNKDPWFHNVFSLYRGKRFDLGLYQAGSTHTVKFDRPGASYIFCNIHPQMSAVVLAVDSEYFAISDKSGRVSISDVPAGKYWMHVWYQNASQEALDHLQREVSIGTGTADVGELRLTVNPKRQLAHKNKYGEDYETDRPKSY